MRTLARPPQAVSDRCSTNRLLLLGAVPPRSDRPTDRLRFHPAIQEVLRVIWAAGGGSVVLLILAIVGLVNLIRNRDKMETQLLTPESRDP